MELVTWRGTPGVGDFMWALNSVHNYCYKNNIKVNLEFHWEHGEDHLHHFEDPETIIERLEYLHNFYHRKDDVLVTHVFNAYGRYRDWKYSDDLVPDKNGSVRIAAISRPEKTRFWFESGFYTDETGGAIPDSDWIFRKDAFRDIDKKKVVIWRPTFNAEVPRTWKRQLTNENWDDIIRQLSAEGLHVVELTYRTPVSEALYHISTCRQIVCYDGMWHYIARNLSIPMVVISTEGITKYHTPHCVRANPYKNENTNIFWWMDNIGEMLGHSKKKAVNYENKIREYHE
jgi:hypothetical protein